MAAKVAGLQFNDLVERIFSANAGALTMAAEQRLRSVNFWSGVVVLCLTIAGALVGIYQLNEVLTDEQQVPLAELSVQGELHYTASEEVRQALTAEPLGSFYGRCG